MDLAIKKTSLGVLTIFITAITSAQALASSNVNFAGPYVGINGGYAWGKSDNSTTTSFVPGSYFFTTDISQINNSGSTHLSLDNFVGGVQTGYNFQFNHLVLGAVLDFDSLSGSASKTSTTTYFTAPDTTYTMYNKTSTDWLLTFRPILGLTASHWLFYATGGLALAPLKTNNTFSDNFLAGTATPSGAFESADETQTKAGWTAGAGVKYAVSDHIIIGGEYLYTSFDNVSTNGTLTFNPAYTSAFIPPFATPSPFKNKADYTASMLRLNINYQFG